MTPVLTNDERLEWPTLSSIDDAAPAQWDAASIALAAAWKAMPAGAVGDINSNAKGSGARYNAGKAPLELIPFRIIAESYRIAGARAAPAFCDFTQTLTCLGLFQETGEELHLYEALLSLGNLKETWEACAKVFDYGRKKYAAWNWAKGMAWSIPLACAGRHTLAVLGGEDKDPESGELHRGHIACNIVMALTFLRTYREGDDLPKVLS
jgi:hypothetical protein